MRILSWAVLMLGLGMFTLGCNGGTTTEPVETDGTEATTPDTDTDGMDDTTPAPVEPAPEVDADADADAPALPEPELDPNIDN